MAQLSLVAELQAKLRKQKGLMSPGTRGATKSYGSRLFKGRNSIAGLMKERKEISPIMKAMNGS